MTQLRIQFKGYEDLEEALKQKSLADYNEVCRRQAREIYTRSQRAGGTPVDTNELRMSARYQDMEMGYNKHYAPHVEYGHRLVIRGRTVGYIKGQYFLKKNVDTQGPLFEQALKDKMKE